MPTRQEKLMSKKNMAYRVVKAEKPAYNSKEE